MSAPPQRPLTPLSTEAVESAVPRLRGRTPIAEDELHLSVLIPVYNEENTIRVIVDQVRTVPIRIEIVCVNDCSTDGSRGILDRMHAAGLIDILVHKERNEGKGAAIRTALEHSTGNVVIVQDADLEYDPADWTLMLDPIVEGKADAVFGSRFLGGSHRVLYYWHRVGNSLLTMVSNMVHEPEPHGHGDLLQGDPWRSRALAGAHVRSVRVRAGGHGAAGPGRRPYLGSTD